jgi:hypothetical protein
MHQMLISIIKCNVNNLFPNFYFCDIASQEQSLYIFLLNLGIHEKQAMCYIFSKAIPVFFSLLSVKSDYWNLITYQEKTNKTLKSHNENEVRFTPPEHLAWTLVC